MSDDRFVMAARVGDRQFPGVTCHNKKDGRKEAADVALRTLIAEGQYSAASPTPSVCVFHLISSFVIDIDTNGFFSDWFFYLCF